MIPQEVLIGKKEAQAIARRRLADEERKKRVYNAKWRTIGIDKDALQKQVEEKLFLKEAEKRRQLKLDATLVRQDRMCVLLEQRRQGDIRALSRAIDCYRVTHQRPQDRREWDLNNPELLKKELPPRLGDDDPRCTVSGLQKFDGEEINLEKKKKMKQHETRSAIEDQIKELQNAQQAQKQFERLYDLKVISDSVNALKLTEAEVEARRRVDAELAAFNQQLEAEKRHQKEQERKREEAANMEEILGSVYGDFLSENPDVAISGHAGHRIVVDRWKGMSEEERTSYRDGQALQRLDSLRRQDEKKKEEEDWDRLALAQSRAVALQTRQEMRLRRDIAKKTMEENKLLAEEQTQRKKYLDQMVYTNQPTPAFFAQFNTTSR